MWQFHEADLEIHFFNRSCTFFLVSYRPLLAPLAIDAYCVRKFGLFWWQEFLLWMLRLWFTTLESTSYYFIFPSWTINFITFLLFWHCFFFFWCVKKSSNLNVRGRVVHTAEGHTLAMDMATQVCMFTQKQFTSVSLPHSQFEMNIFKEYLFLSVSFWREVHIYILFLFSPLASPKPLLSL